MFDLLRVQDIVAGLSQQSGIPVAVCAVHLAKADWDQNLALSWLWESDPPPPLDLDSPGDPPAGWCAVCQDDIGADETVMCCFRSRRSQHHFFHSHCLQPWVQQCLSSNQPPQCPVCRGHVLPPAGYALWGWRLVFDLLGEADPAWEAAAAALRRPLATAPPSTRRPPA
eukprot:EG_transcript_22439